MKSCSICASTIDQCVHTSIAPCHALTRVLLSVRPTLPRGGGGLAEFQGGWVSNHPPPGWGGTLWGPLGLSSQCHFFLSSVAGSM